MSQRIRKSASIAADVDAVAQEWVDEVEGFADWPIEAVRAVVWSEYPELYGEYRKALDAEAADPESLPEKEPVRKQHRDPTLADVITEAVHKRADELLWSRWPDKSESEVIADVWLSDEGAQLYGLAKSDLGKVPFWQARQVLRKNSAHADAWRTLREWR